MTIAHLSSFFHRLTRRIAALPLRDHSDQELVELALGGHDEPALEAIVQRHGPMVFRVCWRVLQHAQDAEDAFQATFLILAQEIRSLRKHASLASWLHAVAHRLSLRSKCQAAARRLYEQRASQPERMPPDDASWGELRSVLDFELGKLPDKWRLPLILCYLEGWTQDESAGQLGWSKKTLRRRLEEARTALANRLKRRGLAWPTALSAVLLSVCRASASPKPGLVASTVEAALNVFSGQTLTACGVSAAVANLVKGGLIMSARKMLLVVALVFLTGMIALAAGIWAETPLVRPVARSGHAALTQAAPQQKEQDERCRQILDKAIQAHGGEQALQKLKYLTISSLYKHENKRRLFIYTDTINKIFNFHEWAAGAEETKTHVNHDEQFKEEIDLPRNATATVVFNGKVGWTAADLDGFTVGEFIPNEIVRAKRELYADMVTRLYALKDKTKGFGFSPLGESKVDGVAVVGVRVACKDQPDINLYFDKNSSLLVKAKYNNFCVGGFKEVEVEKLFSDFKELIPGLKIPAKIAVAEGEEKYEVEITGMRAVQRHAANVFAEPKEP